MPGATHVKPEHMTTGGVLPMALRLLDDYRPNNVIPLRPKENRPKENTVDHNCGVGTPLAAGAPEPARLYHLIVRTFLLHVPSTWPEVCASCDRCWPCEPVRLAFRLREGF
jgi:hypothetical protein